MKLISNHNKGSLTSNFTKFLVCRVALFLIYSGTTLAATLTRTFSATTYAPSQPLNVTITITTNTTVMATGIEEIPPSGWTISNVSAQGVVVDDTGKITAFSTGTIKWGVFIAPTALPAPHITGSAGKLDWNPTTQTGSVTPGLFTNLTNIVITYTATPPANATGPNSFFGKTSFDGLSLNIATATLIGPLHSADTGSPTSSIPDSKISQTEVNLFNFCYKKGSPVPTACAAFPLLSNVDYLNYATKAKTIYGFSMTGSYRFDPSQPAPNCWVPQ